MTDITDMFKDGSVLIKAGDWFFDVFKTESGSLGISVYEKGQNPLENEDLLIVDIFVNGGLEVISI